MSLTTDALADLASVIPVLTVSDVADAAPLARALEAGGLKVIEMTWRTAAALDVLQAMKAAAPGLVVGMGTIRTPEQAAQSVSAGADFLVSPGLTPKLVPALLDAGIPVLPGVATASEAMAAAEAGFDLLKFFPAEQAGGLDYLKSLQGPLPDIRFCPTGSITRERAPDYLALGNVVCVGGSWIASKAMVEQGDWAGIEANARAAAAMRT
ncbi:bifunctional 4-hydroxy-2-oxoglutarate aldolase/2-dehydro-3-deoxy-phosphogluconate aldolase [Maricaulis sp.]|jgi:2-dehydro-3-deoxyphosphogluconate aldolase/(4S)-4-hydroxy-2-oxoglutarate aldolase|uniref:bifunctional 4-hydroxy-2-oxoglutarate aldolase/2-dehydro-3-deoxy-phosphogluconate aldolase n=1 Tax=Maricaulis sp. TaxID=1486257 RepID=UPI001B1C8BE9|nr:bifunctional 4-hydroxy-2-oxoglutarate aldolase/2-dehydro-3-deoxy-phosphogluconate aldolase [Maricaulis sp.]MBO6763676.1 bifunctional 4-hydroxy-2-oxoglutarate aldolase/2-dehydro-3-deoxy-phosphogluconate aldolase [Maricaulis sp.]